MDRKRIDSRRNSIHLGDCIAGMNGLPAGSIDLAFADPPFNIGYDYDVYDDRKQREEYLAWSRAWICCRASRAQAGRHLLAGHRR